MRRNILFRAKDKKTGRWVEGQYVFTRWTGEKKHYIIPRYAIEFFVPDLKKDGFYGIEVLPETLGQYIGQVDKNGKEIFEGDIVRYDSECNNPYRVCEKVGYINESREHLYGFFTYGI